MQDGQGRTQEPEAGHPSASAAAGRHRPVTRAAADRSTHWHSRVVQELFLAVHKGEHLFLSP